METMFSAKQVDEMLLTQKAAFIDQLCCGKKKKLLTRDYGISARTGERYRRLANLIPELGEMVNMGRMPILSGVALSYLEKEEQERVFRSLVRTNVRLSNAAANKLKRNKGKLSKRAVNEIVAECKVESAQRSDVKINVGPDTCGGYFRGMQSGEVEQKIKQILHSWFKEHAQEERLLLVQRLYGKGAI